VKVLITDGHLKATLAAVRSLGRRGFDVFVTQARAEKTLASASRYCRGWYTLPSYHESQSYDKQLLELLSKEKFDYMILASDGAVKRGSLNREEIGKLTHVDLPPLDSLESVLSKYKLLEYADSIGIPIPKTSVFKKIEKMRGFQGNGFFL